MILRGKTNTAYLKAVKIYQNTLMLLIFCLLVFFYCKIYTENGFYSCYILDNVIGIILFRRAGGLLFAMATMIYTLGSEARISKIQH